MEPLWDQVVSHFLEVTLHSLTYLFAGYPDILLGLLTLQLHVAARCTFKSKLENYGAWCPGSIHMCCLRFRAIWRRSAQIKRFNSGCEISLRSPCLNSRVVHLIQKGPCFDLFFVFLFLLGRIKVNRVEVSWVCCTIFSQGSLLFCSKVGCSSWFIKNSSSCTGGIYTIWNSDINICISSITNHLLLHKSYLIRDVGKSCTIAGLAFLKCWGMIPAQFLRFSMYVNVNFHSIYWSYSSPILLRSVADASEKDLATLGFQVSQGWLPWIR